MATLTRFYGALFLVSMGSLQASSPACRDELIELSQGAPVTLQVGVADIHRYQLEQFGRSRLVSVYTPTSFNARTSILDFQFLAAQPPKPTQFVMSGGWVFDTFYYFDLRAGSLLRKRLQAYVAHLRQSYNLEGLEQSFEDFLLKSLLERRSFEKALYFSEELPFEMRTNLKIGPEAQSIMHDYLSRSFTGPNPLITSVERKALSFLSVLDPARKRVCFENAWLAALILDEAGIANRVRFGQAALEEPNLREKVGHAIVELADGRILDVEWGFLGQAQPHPLHQDWFKIQALGEVESSMWWNPYKHYPGLVIEEP